MRKLGHGHSVMFFAPPAVDRSIRAAVSKTDPKSPMTTVDIICWAIHETWADIQQRAPYWAQQGMNHRSRHGAWYRFLNGAFTREQLSDAWLQPDLKSLTDLYAPCSAENAANDLSALHPDDIRQCCKDLGVLSLPSARLDEEQEREVHRERERERQVELPPWAKAKEHHLHPAVSMFVRTGILLLYTPRDFRPVFTTLGKTLTSSRDADIWNPSILATADFCRTIKPKSTRGTIDQYLRPVQWILSRTTDRYQVFVLLSPFEVAQLLPDIRASKHVRLHVYAPRTSQRMRPSDDLKLYTIPPLPSDWTPPWTLIDQLNVFSGQLYLRDYESYRRLCRFLKVPMKESSNNSVMERKPFNIRGSLKEMKITFSARGSPLPFVKALLAIRTRGQPFAHTHMGKILQGQSLTRDEFETVASRSDDT